MNIHEYQAKALFHEYGIRVPEGHVAHSASQAQALAASTLNAAYAIGRGDEIGSLEPGKLDEDRIGWVVAPCLNAAGRLADGLTGYNLLMTDDERQVQDLVRRYVDDEVLPIIREAFDVLDTRRRGRVTLRDVDELFEALLAPVGLTFRLQGNVLEVTPAQ